jgi:membrane protein
MAGNADHFEVRSVTVSSPSTESSSRSSADAATSGTIMTTISTPGPATPSWKEQSRRAWVLVRQTATLIGPSAKFLTTCEAHTYAYSVAANAILALVPFLVLLITIAHLTQSLPAERMIYQLVAEYLPAGAVELKSDLVRLTSHRGVQVFSLIMLAVSASGVFLPFEVALNGVWGFKKNRSYVGNQIVSLLLVGSCAALAYAGVVFAAAFKAALVDPIHILWLNAGLNFIVMKVFALPMTILSFWLVFWWLPNGHVPVVQVFPAAFYTGLLAEVVKLVFGWVLPLLDFQRAYGRVFWLPVTLLVWTYVGAVLLLFGASLSARGVIKMRSVRLRTQEPVSPVSSCSSNVWLK